MQNRFEERNKKVILFVSRVRGNNKEHSDIDLAVADGNFLEFCFDAEEAWTLLMFDVVDFDRGISEELQKEIERDGVVLYKEI